MSIMQIAAELGDDKWFSGHEFDQAWISFVNFKPERLEPLVGARCKRAISAERYPVAIILARKIIFEGIPFCFRVVVPIHMPDPGQIVRAFRTHEIDNVPVSGDVTLRSLARAAVPFSVPTEPIAIRFRPPFNQNRRSEPLGVTRPRAKIDIELTGNDFLERKCFLAVTLIDIRP